MIDEKLIKHFIEGAKEAFKKVDNPTFTFPMNILSAYELATSIEELLKEHEAVKPVFECEEPTLRIGQFHCGYCHQSFGISHYRFCPFCGKAVKWDG